PAITSIIFRILYENAVGMVFYRDLFIIIFDHIADDFLYFTSFCNFGKSNCPQISVHKNTSLKRPAYLQAFFSILVMPPIYGCSAFGMLTLPSAFKLFSKNAISILGGATTVLFNVWARYFLPPSPLTRIFSLRAWA